MRIDLYDGKYTYVCNDDGSDQHALRYGERWRDLVGDGFVLAMAQKIEELELELQKSTDQNDLILDEFIRVRCLTDSTEIHQLCERAHIRMRQNVPVIERNHRMEKRIAELESHNLGLTKTLVEIEQERAIRDLEQQAKGVEDALKFEKEQSNRMAFGGLSEFVLSKYANQLREQAKQLKEEGK